MAWPSGGPATAVAGVVATASFVNTNYRDALNALNTGHMEIASQAAGDLLYASSAEQLERLPIGSAGQVLKVNSGGNAPEFGDGTDVEALDKSPSNVQVANTTIETTIYSFTVPANTLGTDRLLVVELIGNIKTDGSTTAITFRLKYGSTTLVSDNPNTGAGTNDEGYLLRALLAADGATNAQLGYLRGVGPTAAVNGRGTAAEDSTGALTLALTVQWAGAAANLDFDKLYAAAYLIR